MKSKKQTNKSPFVKLDEEVSFASSSDRVVQTKQAGRVIGFGCSNDEQEAFESLKGFVQQARENPGADQGDFEQQLHEKVKAFEEQIAKDQRGRSKQ